MQPQQPRSCVVAIVLRRSQPALPDRSERRVQRRGRRAFAGSRPASTRRRSCAPLATAQRSRRGLPEVRVNRAGSRHGAPRPPAATARRRRGCRRHGPATMHRGAHRRRDVRDVNAVEDLSSFDDAPRGAGTHRLDGAAAGSVDAGQAEDDDPFTARPAARQPVIFGRQSTPAARRHGRRHRVLIHPSALAISVDADRG